MLGSKLEVLNKNHRTDFVLVQAVRKVHFEARGAETRKVSPGNTSIWFGENFIPVK